MPLTEKEEDMPKMGWKKNIIFDWIVETKDGRFIKETYEARADMFPCPRCKTADMVWLKLMPTGVVWTCFGCKITTGAMTREVLNLLDRQEVSMQEAYEISKKQADHKKMFTPEKIAFMKRQMAMRKRRKTRRTR